jgi:hypothetical protein
MCEQLFMWKNLHQGQQLVKLISPSYSWFNIICDVTDDWKAAECVIGNPLEKFDIP